MGEREGDLSLRESEEFKNGGLLVIKLGGSVITYKESATPKPRMGTIRSVASESKDLIDAGFQLILVHGAGSFGHSLVNRYQLQEGVRTKEEKLGYSLTVQSITDLNSLVVKELLRVGVPAIGISPHAFVKQSKGRFVGFDERVIRDFLDRAFVPVLFGDLVLDEQLGGSILSGDVIVPYLAQRLGSVKVIFLSDVDGVFDSDPRLKPDARQIQRITDDNFEAILRIFDEQEVYEKRRNDVTGEMRGKILAIKENLSGVEVIITNGLKRGSLFNGLRGKFGTVLKFGE